MRLDNFVRERRQASGLTQEALAARCLVSRQTVIALEKGNYEPSLGLALRLADVLGATVEELFRPGDAL